MAGAGLLLAALVGCGERSRSVPAGSSHDGGCDDGRCSGLTEQLFESDENLPGALAVDEANVYWVGGVGAAADSGRVEQIVKCAKSGCENSPTVLAQGTWGFVSNLAIADGAVYWGGYDAIYRCATGGCAGKPTVWQVAAPLIDDVAADSAGNVYFVDETSGGKLSECTGDLVCNPNGDLAWLPASGLFPDGGPNEWYAAPIAVAADSQGLYVLASASPYETAAIPSQDNVVVVSCSPGACATTARVLAIATGTFAATDVTSLVLTVDEGAVYFATGTNPMGVAIERAPKADGGPTSQGPSEPTKLLDGLNSPVAMASDGTNFYVAEMNDPDTNGGGVPNTGRISRCAVTGCSDNAEVVRGYVNLPTGLAIDETNVYWTEFDPNVDGGRGPIGRVMMRPK